VLRGRRTERETLDELLEAVREGESRALVIRGEPGVGKTALLEHLLERATGFRVARAAGVQSEMELPFAVLHQLCAPMLDRLERLPEPQRDALATAFGLSGGSAPDRFLVGLAALSLFADVAEDRPLLCVIDDAQWSDQASALTVSFVARRLFADAIGVIFATRGPGGELPGLPELVIEGLPDEDARALLSSAISAPVDERVLDRIVAETRGNPLALLELPRGLSAAQVAGGFGLPDALPLSGRIEESFRRRFAALPADSQRLLLIAAADPTGDSGLVWRAAKQLGTGSEAAADAEVAGLFEPGPQLRFRHPLVRSAVYRSALPEDRRRAHGALAAATDPDIDPDRRAWHHAHATAGPDEGVAAELERSAARARSRGGLSAAAAFLEQATVLTPSPALRAPRALAAAHLKHQAGAFEEARKLLATADAGPLDESGQARVNLLRGQLAFTSSRGRDAPALLLRAGRRLESVDVGLARETYLEAFSAALFAGRLGSAETVRQLAEAARAAPAPQRYQPRDLLLDGLAELVTGGFRAGVPILKRAVSRFGSEEISTEEGLRWLWLAGHAAAVLWDFETWREFAVRHVQLAREEGALNVLPIALSTRVGAHLLAGELAEAASLVEETEAIGAAAGSRVAGYGALPLVALQGRQPEATKMVDVGTEEVLARGEGLGLTSIQYSAALLYNGLGRYEEALAVVEQTDHPAEQWSYFILPELIEAAARSGRIDRVGGSLQRLSERTRAAGTDWALGIEARSRALVSTSGVTEALYCEAIERLPRSGVRIELARAHLVYGEWLRRENRRVDAREQLRTAHEMFTAFGMEAFAERARRELLATGETARKRTVETRDQLTAQEEQIARLARDGLSNPKIASQLFISPRTVEYHLSKVFSKLDISSRTQLDRVLSDDRIGGKG
jgi:DNA-binding CsgD family transcriptional regulator